MLRTATTEDENSEAALIQEYDVPGAAADEVLGFDDDDDDAYEVEEEDRPDSIAEEISDGVRGNMGASPENFEEYKTQIRIQETQRAEKNRRAGGIKTQNAMVRAWEVSLFTN